MTTEDTTFAHFLCSASRPYSFVKTTQTWQASQQICTDNGMKLAIWNTADTVEDIKFITGARLLHFILQPCIQFVSV